MLTEKSYIVAMKPVCNLNSEAAIFTFAQFFVLAAVGQLCMAFFLTIRGYDKLYFFSIATNAKQPQ